MADYFKHRNNYGKPIIQIKSKHATPSFEYQAMYAYAFMHLEDAIDGGVVIWAENEEDTEKIYIASLPSDFDSFRYLVSDSLAVTCQVTLPCDNECTTRVVELTICGNDAYYNLLYPKADLVLIGLSSWTDDDLSELLQEKLLPLFERVKLGFPLPTRDFTNPEYDEIQNHAKFLSSKADKNGKIHVGERSETDTRQYYCFRDHFRFFCSEDIDCCGECPIINKAYDILIKEALDEESAFRLDTLVYRSGLLGAHGGRGYDVCWHRGVDCPRSKCTLEGANGAIDEIRRYWAECFV